MNKKEEWLAIAQRQEELLAFEQFDREDVLALGLKVIELAKSKYGKGIAVRIDSDGATTFYHLMQGTSLDNDWWMKKKLNTCQETNISSFRTFLEVEYAGRKHEDWMDDTGSFVLCGGCIPVKLKSGKTVGHLIVSNLSHEADHQLAADAMAVCLNVEIPTVI